MSSKNIRNMFEKGEFVLSTSKVDLERRTEWLAIIHFYEGKYLLEGMERSEDHLGNRIPHKPFPDEEIEIHAFNTKDDCIAFLDKWLSCFVNTGREYRSVMARLREWEKI